MYVLDDSKFEWVVSTASTSRLHWRNFFDSTRKGKEHKQHGRLCYHPQPVSSANNTDSAAITLNLFPPL